ncbi:group XIIB secretory phospholipase A2-like protein [Cricetulus griseus]|uniref:Group XIIA secretory phospholipase A2 n=1 Tax=Cricetulus griseus TaxID=10029 RepID=A0A061IQX2_CRIGR|nr:group XIIB secretory phospholipase A2-like protein [Cricetulus griseus]
MIPFVFYIGSKPFPRYGYKPSPPNGCGSPLFGVHLNIGIPSLTKCCNQHDRCYETCGKSKNDCDEEFQYCLSKICRDVQKTLGLSQNVQACETTVELLFDSVIHLGCKPYLDSQRAACWCRYEEKTDLGQKRVGSSVELELQAMRGFLSQVTASGSDESMKVETCGGAKRFPS